MSVSLKEKILELRNSGKKYDEIQAELKCSKGTISYHCKKNGLGGNDRRDTLTVDEISSLNVFYKIHTIEECMVEFNISKSTVVKHTKNKSVKLTDDEIKKRNYNKVKVHRQKIKEKAVEYKGGKCSNCGYNKCIWAFEFHHLDPSEKDFGISKYSTLSWNRIKVELDKCIMLCANCHRELHYEIYLNGL